MLEFFLALFNFFFFYISRTTKLSRDRRTRRRLSSFIDKINKRTKINFYYSIIKRLGLNNNKINI